MATECTVEQLEFHELGRRKVSASFDGGRITSDGGAFLLREVDLRINLMDRLAGCLRFETDLLVLVDSFAVIVEAKSGQISDPALRGADAWMKRHFKELLIEPNDQSKRLMDKLLRLQAGEEADNELTSKLPVEIADIREIVRLSVTLDDFATIQANVNRWKDTGWVPADYVPCPTLCLSDLETLVDLLDDPCLVMHYLQTRQEIEHHLDYMGDELDLMGLYLNNLFDIVASDGAPMLNISGMSANECTHYSAEPC